MGIQKEHSQQRDGQSGLLALLMLLGGGAALLWFVLGKTKRAEVEFIIWRANQGALIASGASLVAVAVLFGLLVQRKSRYLTSAVEEAHSEFTPEVTGGKRAVVYAPHVVVSLLGLGVYGYYYLSGVTRWVFFDFLARPDYAVLRGALVLLSAALPVLLIPCYVGILLNGSGIARIWRARLLEHERGKLRETQLPDPGDYQAGGTNPVFLLGARESSDSLRFEPDAKIPSWVKFSSPSIFGGLLIFGRKGSGKTCAILRMLDDAIRFRFGTDDETRSREKPAICILDQKGDIAQFVTAKAKEYGREADVTRLGVDTEAKWNPFGTLDPTSTALECRQVGFFMRCAMAAGSTTSTENAFWQDNADNLIFRSVHLLALAGEAVSFGSVYRAITSVNAQETFRDELFARAEQAMNLRATLGADVSDTRQELADTERYFEEDFTKLDQKVRTTVTSVVSNFHQKFMNAQYARSFGCSPNTPGHFGGFRDLIAQGKIFILDVRANEHGTVATALAMLAKLHYQAAVKTRDRYAADSMSRATVFVMDEAQACITPSTANTEGDDKYLEMSRSFKAIDVFATQQYSSFTAAVGKDMAQRIIGSFNNLIVYRHNDPALTEYLQKLVGQEERDEKSVSVTESSSSAQRNVLAVEGETERDRQVSRSVSVQRRERALIDAALFKGMSVFEALGFFDQPRGLAITHFFTKPNWLPARMPHAEVVRRVEETR